MVIVIPVDYNLFNIYDMLLLLLLYICVYFVLFCCSFNLL